MPHSRSPWALLVFERGLSIPIPDLAGVPAGRFPVWGDYYLQDFQLEVFSGVDELSISMVASRTVRDAGPQVTSHPQAGRFSVITPQGNGLRDIIASLDADSLLLSTSAYAALFDPMPLVERAPRDRIIKAAVNGTPLDLYAMRKKNLLALLDGVRGRPYGDHDPVTYLFDRLLHDAFTEIRDLPGRVLFCRDLTAFYKSNLELALHPLANDALQWRSALDARRVESPPSHISPAGSVSSSHIGSGVEVSGTVENSVLFSGVTVASGATVRDSVVMNDNHIGRGADIRNTLILPNRRDRLRQNVNIGEKVVIGGPSGSVRNGRYSSQIYDGLTVLGVSVELPRGVTVDQGCYISGSFPAARLRRLRRLPQGESYLKEDNDET